jgi:hypothetical protein
MYVQVVMQMMMRVVRVPAAAGARTRQLLGGLKEMRTHQMRQLRTRRYGMAGNCCRCFYIAPFLCLLLSAGVFACMVGSHTHKTAFLWMRQLRTKR